MSGLKPETQTLKRALKPALYKNQTIFDKEQDTVFKKNWRLIGHENMIPAPGDYLLDAIADSPIIAVRDKEGTIRGFHNVCRHRAGPLVDEASGNCGKELTCKYHGWRYTLDGRLRSARDFGGADSFDPRDFSLYGVTLAHWRGFIFATLSKDSSPIDALMAPVDEDWASEDIQPFAFRRSHDIACNWKTYVENYLEGYHVPDVHPGLNTEIDAAAYRVEMKGSVAVHIAPPRIKDPVYTGYWAWVWPWLGVNTYQHGVMMERITPISARKTRLDYLYFFDAERRDELAAMTKLSDDVTNEDKQICEQVQTNLDAGVYEAGPISPKHENAVAWFQDRLRMTVGY